jgi:hypothetical protein
VAKIYVRRKEAGKGWRYRAVPKVGRPLQTEPGVKFPVRFRDASGKFVWGQAYDTLEEARKESAGLELNAKAVALGLTVKEYKNSKNAHRTAIKTAIEHFIADARKTQKRTTAAEYERNLKQFESSPPIQKIRFMDEITKKTLCEFRDFLAADGYEPRTLHNRLLLVLTVLKANGIKTQFSLGRDLPKYEEEAAVPYEPAELRKLFASMDEEETCNVTGATVQANGTSTNVNGNSTFQAFGHLNSSATQLQIVVFGNSGTETSTLIKQ